MRATWNGYFTIGALSVPVRMYSAVKASMPRFVQLHAADHSPVTRMTVCQKDGEEVDAKDIIRAVAYEGGYVEVSDEEIANQVTDSKCLMVRQFSDPQEIDALYYDKPYYILPGEGGEFAYAILRQAFMKAKKVAIVTYLLYERQHIGVVSVADGVLRLQQLRYADTILKRSELPPSPLSQPAPGQVASAVELMERYSSPFFLEDYQNDQVAVLNEIVVRRAKGLGLKRRRKISREATKERDVVSTIRTMIQEREARELPGA